MASGLHIVSAGAPNNPVQQFFSADVDFIVMDWSQRLSGESISASGVSAFITWYLPTGFTGFLSGTAAGASGIWVKVSATGAPGGLPARVSAKVTTTSGKNMSDWFDIQVYSGYV